MGLTKRGFRGFPKIIQGSVQILLSNSQAGPGRKVKEEQEEISRNHVQAFIPDSVHGYVRKE